ncbi:hypothetical protein SKB0120_24530 (plasmid) [Moraxella osloensis]
MEIVILANSVKNHAHCVAGKCLITGRWIRPVADCNGAELTANQVKVTNPYGSYPVKLLQKIYLGNPRHAPLINQPENYILDNVPWQQRYKIDLSDLPRYLDNPSVIWNNEGRVRYSDITNGNTPIGQSLFLIAVQNLELFIDNTYPQRPRRRARFLYNNVQYTLAVTDPNFENLLNNHQNLMNILCISLAQPYEFNGDVYCYKVVASIF